MSHQIEGESRGFVTWAEALPWLEPLSETLESEMGAGWSSHLVGTTSEAETSRTVGRIAAVVAERLRNWELAEVVPGVTWEAASDIVTLGIRYRHERLALLRRRGEVLTLTIADLVPLVGGSAAMHDVIVRGLLTEQVLAAERAAAQSEARVQRSGDAEDGSLRPESSTTSFVEAPTSRPHNPQLDAGADTHRAFDRAIRALSILVAHNIAIGKTDQPLLTPDRPDALPDLVAHALKELRALSVDDLVVQRTKSAAELLDDAIREENEFSQSVLRSRLFADTEATLEEVGSAFGVSRERARQVAGAARARLERHVANEPTLGLVNDSLRRHIDELLPLDVVLRELPAVTEIVRSVQQPVWRVLDRLDDSYEITDGWCSAGSTDEARRVLAERLRALQDQHGVVKLDDLAKELPPHFSTEDGVKDTVAWCEYNGHLVRDQVVLTRTGSLPDLAAGALAVAGAPLTAEQILDWIGQDRALSSLKNALGADQRFNRVDRNSWALVEWDFASYTSVRELIGSYLDLVGGEAPLAEVVEAICSRYSVKDTSVTAYAAAPPYEVIAGIVRRLAAPKRALGDPLATKRIYKTPNGWSHRINITEDHVRGSGFQAPAAMAAAFGLAAGESRNFYADHGSVSLRWTSLQPTYGSIRSSLIRRSLSVGDAAHLVLNIDGTFDVKPIGELEGDPIRDAAKLVGVPIEGTPEVTLQQIAVAIGLHGPVDASSVLRRSAMRADDDVTALLEKVVATASQANAETPSTEPAEQVTPEGFNTTVRELVRLNRDFKAAQLSEQFELAEHIQSQYGRTLRAFMRDQELDLSTAIGIIEAGAADTASTA